MQGKPTSEAPKRERIRTPVEHGRRDHTSGIDTVEGRQSSRNANIDAQQQKYREVRKPSRS